MLSNIEGATSSKAVEQLFETIRNTAAEINKDDEVNLLSVNPISSDNLREDKVIEASVVEKQLIIANFPKQKDNYLVVPKVMEE